MGILLIPLFASKKHGPLADVDILQMQKGRYMKENIVARLREFIENEARSGSMDPGCITPLYVYRMWGGVVPMEEIEAGLKELKSSGLGL